MNKHLRPPPPPQQRCALVSSAAGFKGRSNDWYRAKQEEACRKIATSQGVGGWAEDDSLGLSRTCQLALNFFGFVDRLTFFLHSLLAGISVWQVTHHFSVLS